MAYTHQIKYLHEKKGFLLHSTIPLAFISLSYNKVTVKKDTDDSNQVA